MNQSVMAQVLFNHPKPLIDSEIKEFTLDEEVTITYFDADSRQKQPEVIIITKSKKEVGLLRIDTSQQTVPTSRSNDWLRSIPAIPLVRLSSYTQYRISSHFGWRAHPINGKRHRHTGIDLPCPAGTPIYATADGVVDQLISDQQGLGLAIIMKHPSGYESVYGHLSACTVRAGDLVLRGAIIGHIGSTGRSTGPHLHYAILYHGKPVNPEQYCLLWLAISGKDKSLGRIDEAE